MMDIEDLVRATQARQADRALPTDRIRAALPSRIARANRQRRLGAVVAAAAVATAVTVPAFTLRPAGTSLTNPPGAQGRQASASASGPAGRQPAAAFPDLRLGYRPGWVPPGYAERIRHADSADPADKLGPALMRVWTKQIGPGDPWGGPELTLYVRTAVADAGTSIDTSGQAVDINGNRGYYSLARGAHKSYVDWALDAHTVLMLTATHLDVSQQDLLRMARTVEPDPGTVAVPVQPRWLPAGWATTGVTVSGPSAAAWRAELTVGELTPDPATSAQRKAQKDPASAAGSVSLVVGSTTDAPAGGKTLTVGGHPARNPARTDEPGKSLTYLVVDLGQGRLMTLVGSGAGTSLAVLTKIAGQTAITPTGLDWLGA